MRNFFRITLFLAIVLALTSFAAHKFYVAIYQVNYAADKKMLQVTSRVFVDDLNEALQKKYKKKAYLGEAAESQADLVLLKQYFTENMSVKVNGKERALTFLSKELENNVLICYFSCRDVKSVESASITNTVLFDYVTEQQNIIQTNINGKKGSDLLTVDTPSVDLKY